MQELDGIEWNYHADLNAKRNTFSAQYVTPSVQAEITDHSLIEIRI